MIYRYFLLFFIYSFMGWFMEVVLSLFGKHKFINRGFLIGPYCPIYGYGCLAITVLLRRFQSDPIVLFIMSMAICSLIEYFTSYIMEKIFHARWWDYSDKKFNINGRICLDFIVAFGFLGSVVVYIINPFFNSLIDKIPSNILQVCFIILFIIFIIDNIISFNVINNLKHTASSLTKDSTEEITNKVREVLNTNILNRRLIHAFPNFEVLKRKTKKKIEEAKREIEKKQEEIKNNLHK